MPVLPGANIGILGGGQLGRMIAMAARVLGYSSICLDPNPWCAARLVVDRLITAPWEDVSAVAELSRRSDVVTLEIEKIPFASLSAASQYAPLLPRFGITHIVQDRARQKEWLSSAGFPLGPYRVVTSEGALPDAVKALGGRCFAKSNSGGYDGRGQVLIEDAASANSAWEALGSRPCVVEKALELKMEISALVARRVEGEAIVFPLSQNHHEQRILAWSVMPADVSPEIARRAPELALAIANALGLVGLLAVELFVLSDDTLLINELAPRPHNSFHSTERACPTSQFEQLVRAICDLPLGSVEALTPAAIANLLGEVWLSPQFPNFSEALKVPQVRLHLYQKQTPRPGRKMGHLSATGNSTQQALDRVREALLMLGRSTSYTPHIPPHIPGAARG